MVFKKILSTLCALTMTGALLAGCGGSPAQTGQTGDGASQNAQTGGASDSAGADAAAQSGTDKHINAALYWFGTSLDPATEWDGWTTNRAGITETLVTVDENYELKPLLAESWEMTDDTTWKLKIRDGVTFHDGSPVDGAAVKASLERVMEVNERGKSAAKIASVEADGQEVTIKTTEPFGAFLANITEPLYSIVKVGDDQDYANAPIATGPFMVTGFSVNDFIETVRYDGYWGGASEVASITFKCIEDDSTRGLALQSGEMDVVQRVSSTDLPIFQSDSNFQALNTTGARVRVIVFNHTNEFLSDQKVRKALAAAIDYASLVKVLGEGVTLAGAPYPSSAPYGYDSLEKQAYDAQAAASLLAEAGFCDSDGDGIVEKGGKPLSLSMTYAMSDYTTMLEAVQSMAKESGIDLQLNLVDSLDEAESSRQFDMICTNWQSLSTGDPQWFLDSLYKSDASTNYTGYANPELDALCDKLAGAFEPDERTAITIEAEKVLLEDAASIWLVGEKNFVVANSKIQNLTPYPIDYYFTDNKISIQ